MKGAVQTLGCEKFYCGARTGTPALQKLFRMHLSTAPQFLMITLALFLITFSQRGPPFIKEPLASKELNAYLASEFRQIYFLSCLDSLDPIVILYHK